MIAWDVAVLNWDACIVYSSCVICLHLPAFSNLNFICSSAAASFNITNIYIKTSINTTPSHHHLSLRLRESFFFYKNEPQWCTKGSGPPKMLGFCPNLGEGGPFAISTLCQSFPKHNLPWYCSKNVVINGEGIIMGLFGVFAGRMEGGSNQLWQNPKFF